MVADSRLPIGRGERREILKHRAQLAYHLYLVATREPDLVYSQVDIIAPVEPAYDQAREKNAVSHRAIAARQMCELLLGREARPGR